MTSITGMRVTVVSSHFPPVGGGVADYTAAWCRAMVELGGAEITVVTSSPAPPADRITIDVIPDDWSRRGRSALASAVEESKPDVILVQWAPYAYTHHGAGLPLALTLRALARCLNVPLVVNGHELYLQWGAIGRRAPWSATQRAAVACLAATSAAFVFTVRAREQRLRRMLFPFRDRFHLIPVGATIPPERGEPKWRQQQGIPDDAVLLACFGLGHPSFRTSALAKALRAMEASNIHCRLVVAGRLRVDHPGVVHLGLLSAADAAQLLATTDVFLLPLSDGASGRRTTLVSALAAGAPIVSTAGPETEAALFPPTAIRLAPAGDDDAFASAAVTLAEDPAARAALRAGAASLYDREFSWPVLARRWANVLAHAVVRPT